MADELGAYALDSAWARRSFDRAAGNYDAAAVLHTDARDNLLERLDLMAIEPKVVVDAGAGTGHGSRALKRRYPNALVVAMDFSAGMLRVAGRQNSWLRPFQRLCADAQQLPFADASVDLIVSNLLLQWCDPDAVFSEFRRVLTPQGLLTLTTFGPDTLRELRAAWANVDTGSRVHSFIDMHDLGDAMVRNGFVSPVLDVEQITLQYRDVNGVAADLKALGAHNATVGRPKGLTGRQKFAAMQSAYEAQRRDGRLPATYEIIFAHAWVPAHSPQRSTADGTEVPLAEIRRQLRNRREK
jgi:malonyl-CoA O-methyltransferase